MSEENRPQTEAAHDQGAPVPKFLLLVYAVIALFFIYYMATGLRFGPNSPTGF
ncbi:hypothetical protein J2Z79_001759 [Symbiobacterium terraclitae]|uniref:Uncharacterized protein n=1 Tax=Symbiobacterium terraclitae TaxID=557451 RepID=A0ABS4JTN0_9FIRM|nr:hypothetical protein [Symbiobacterium terraclitae]MBP2018351.1 hypothetical protein [Symbiobacterium terraclitae]